MAGFKIILRQLLFFVCLLLFLVVVFFCFVFFVLDLQKRYRLSILSRERKKTRCTEKWEVWQRTMNGFLTGDYKINFKPRKKGGREATQHVFQPISLSQKFRNKGKTSSYSILKLKLQKLLIMFLNSLIK